MEVHHHAHTDRKKWTHYFWEFLMLFLAVFCGFLAENQREHMIEHRREKQFMKSLAEDLKIDTAEIQRTILQINKALFQTDSLLLFFKSNSKIQNPTPAFSTQNNIALPWLSFSLIDRTALQLKNAGNMRLIRNKKISDQVLEYWSKADKTIDRQDRFSTYRLKARELFFKMYRVYEHYLYNNQLIDEPVIGVQNNDPSLLGEYGNYLASCGTIIKSMLLELKNQNELAVQLINSLNKTYHLE